jgi:hypothetical protein
MSTILYYDLLHTPDCDNVSTLQWGEGEGEGGRRLPKHVTVYTVGQ